MKGAKELRMKIMRRLEAYVNATLQGQAIPFHQLGTGAVGELERKLKQYTGMRHALLVSNATTGLLLLALALGLRRAHFVTTPYTWAGSLVWMYLGCRISFADADPSTLTLDPDSVRRCIAPRTKILLSVDMDGVPADDDALRRIADEHGLFYIYDGAQSLGARRNGRPAGTRAHALVLSFTHRKTLDLGEGGAVLTDDPNLYDRLIFYGQHPLRQKREFGLEAFNESALNARIHPLAALWGAQAFEWAMEKLNAYQQYCRRLIAELNATGLTVPVEFEERGIEPTYHRLTVAWKGKPQYQALLERLNERWRVKLQPHPGCPVYRQPAFVRLFERKIDAYDCPVVERELARRFIVHAADEIVDILHTGKKIIEKAIGGSDYQRLTSRYNG
jgi:perosamine synthetase